MHPWQFHAQNDGEEFYGKVIEAILETNPEYVFKT